MSGHEAERGAPVIQAVGLRKSYGSVEAVRDLSFEVLPGSVYGLLGLNGAGKTTTIRLILGLLAPDAGRSTVFGEDSLALPRAARRRIGYLSETPIVPQDLPVPYLLRYASAFFDRWDWKRTERSS
jgi:ABC-2 type transport system ATP-binding protein